MEGTSSEKAAPAEKTSSNAINIIALIKTLYHRAFDS
jgi:hypothetical protein